MGFAVRVNLMSVPPTSASVLRKVDAVEAKLAQGEQTLFEQAAREMHGLTSIVLGELESQLRLHARRGAGFLQTKARDLPQVANVAVGAAGPFATIAAQVQGMESKQTVSTIAVLRRILELEQQLLKTENALVQKALAEAVA